MRIGLLDQLDRIFKARSIAVIGASNTPPKWGYRMVKSPFRTGYRGHIYPVNPNEKEICGLPCYPDILDIEDEIDMAVIAVPAWSVPEAMKRCAMKGVKGAVIISAGFAETGNEGRALQERVVRIAREGGIRFVGPNCMGIYSSAVQLNLCFEAAPVAGKVAFVSQSGTFGHSLAEVASRRGYGLSKFISIGNQADLTAGDYLEYLGEDKDTEAVIFYMEGFKDGRRFLDIAKSVIKKKPIIIYKAGKTEASARATLSHTGSIAGSEEIFDAICRQLGLIRTQEATHPFEMAEALVNQPIPRGNRVAIIGSGGQGVVISDSCESLGLKVPEFDSKTKRMLKRELPPHAPEPSNPVDFAGALRTPLDEARVVEAIASIDSIDGIITNIPIYGFSSHSPGEMARLAIEGAEVLTSIPGKYKKPVIALKWGPRMADFIQDIIKKGGIPVYDTPEQCARAMYALYSYSKTRNPQV